MALLSSALAQTFNPLRISSTFIFTILAVASLNLPLSFYPRVSYYALYLNTYFKKFSILVKLRWLRPKRRRRQIALQEYLQCICTLTASNGDITDDAQDQSIRDYAFRKDTVVDLACQYLTFLAIT